MVEEPIFRTRPAVRAPRNNTNQMNDNNQRYFSPDQKVAILHEHLIEGKAISDLCDSFAEAFPA